MDDKIQMLAGHLPPFLVEHRRLYGILSKGVHALGEDECLEAFPAVRAAIEMMLDEKVNAKKVEDRKEAAKKSIAALEQKLATSGEAKPAENP